MATVLIVETQLDRDFVLEKRSAAISLKSIQAFGRFQGVTRTHELICFRYPQVSGHHSIIL